MIRNQNHQSGAIRRPLRLYFSYAWLTFILIAACRRLSKAFPASGAELNADARFTYLPNARKLLESPWNFLTTDPASYHVAPLGYVWPAFWRADPFAIQLANCGLFLISLLLLWRCATRLGGLCAGVVATALLVLNNGLVHHIPQVLTESTFLVGLMMLIAGSVEYTLGKHKRRSWLAVASLGLTITLLSRPVLQLFTAAALTGGLVIVAALSYRRRVAAVSTPSPAHQASRQVCLALAAALLLPAAVVVKNGFCFGLWGLGTGAGTGLYYGVSPFKMGLEPVFSNFRYDAGASAAESAPETQGNPLHLRSDQINARAAMEIVRATSLPDNLRFFAHKLGAWLFYSTPELLVSYQFRAVRLFEWLTICASILVLTWQWRRKTPLSLPGPINKVPLRVGAVGVLLLLTLAMALQLVPVLYNTRYNAYFIEPWLIVVCGVAVSVLLHSSAASSRSVGSAGWAGLSKALQHGVPRWTGVCLLLAVSVALARHAERNESWEMDPYRPGPTQSLLDATHLGKLQSQQATQVDAKTWRLDSNPATLRIPINLSDPALLHPHRVRDALWRMRLGLVTADNARRSCGKARLQVTPSHPSLQPWFIPPPTIYLDLNGRPRTYAVHGNDAMRPSGSGFLGITFTCPAGTLVTWEGVELRRSTLPEAIHALIHDGVAIDPYLRSDPPAPAP